jgi:uncharacterized protein (DUF302 family)
MFATTDITPSFTIAGAFVPSAGERALPSTLSLSLSLPIGCRA